MSERIWTLDEIKDEAAHTEIVGILSVRKTEYVVLQDTDARAKRVWKISIKGKQGTPLELDL